MHETGTSHTTPQIQISQSNGLAESSVKNVKNILKKSKKEDFYKAFLAYRATPLNNRKSPANMLMRRQIKTTLPTHPLNMDIEESPEVAHFKVKGREKQKEYFDRGTKLTRPLRIHEPV